MASYLVKLAIFAGVLVVATTLIFSIPSVQAIANEVTTSIAGLPTVMAALMAILANYGAPLLATFALIIGINNFRILLILITVRMLEPVLYPIMDMTAGFVAKLNKNA